MPFSRRWRIDSREKFERVLRALKAFEPDFARYPCEVIIREELVPLSDRQRALFHAVCADAAPHFGQTPGQFKKDVKREYFGDGFEHMSTEDLSHEQYGQLIDTAYLVAAEGGVVIPDRRSM